MCKCSLIINHNVDLLSSNGSIKLIKMLMWWFSRKYILKKSVSVSLNTDYLTSAFFFFFSCCCARFLGDKTILFMNNSRRLLTFQPSFINSVGPVNNIRDPQTSLFSNIFIKNGSHDTIYTFKNYFATVFLIFSFNKISSIQTDP